MMYAHVRLFVGLCIVTAVAAVGATLTPLLGLAIFTVVGVPLLITWLMVIFLSE